MWVGSLIGNADTLHGDRMWGRWGCCTWGFSVGMAHVGWCAIWCIRFILSVLLFFLFLSGSIYSRSTLCGSGVARDAPTEEDDGDAAMVVDGLS